MLGPSHCILCNSGFQNHNSMATVKCLLLENIKAKLGTGRVVAVVLLDLKKAFDSSRILIKNLSKLIYPPDINKWIPKR